MIEAGKKDLYIKMHKYNGTAGVRKIKSHYGEYGIKMEFCIWDA